MEYMPIFKLLSFNEKYYMYDLGKNKILSIPYKIYCTLKQGKTEFSSIQNNRDILHLIQKGYFSKPVVENIYNNEVEYVNYMLQHQVGTLILQITQSCNFKCRYCSFATENEYDRQHTNKHMSLELAFKSIDFMFQHSKDLAEVNICFYGGEPLINFDNICECINYANQLFKMKKINYSITTNGSLLSKKIISFFEKNAVDIHISIDGPKHINNKHRRFSNDGGETFDLVNNNIIMIKNKFLNYFKDHVFFISVVYPDEDKENIYSYFRSLDVSLERVLIRPVNSFGTDLKYDEKVLSVSLQNQNDLKSSELDNYNKFLSKFNNDSPLFPLSHPNGMCVPGRDKVFVTVDGNFYPCEKVNENNKYVIIGNINEGFNVEKIKELINLPQLTEKECKKCWAFRFCEMCICHCEDYTCGISKLAKLQECDKQKKIIERYMFKYIQEKEGVQYDNIFTC